MSRQTRKVKSRYWWDWDLDPEHPHASPTHWPLTTALPPLRILSLLFLLPVVWKPAKKKVIDCAMISSSLNLLTPSSFSSFALSINCTRSFEPVNSFFRLSFKIPFRIFPKKSMFCRKLTYLQMGNLRAGPSTMTFFRTYRATALGVKVLWANGRWYDPRQEPTDQKKKTGSSLYCFTFEAKKFAAAILVRSLCCETSVLKIWIKHRWLG